MTATPSVDFGYPTLSSQRPRLSWHVSRRSVLVVTILSALTIAAILLSIATGTYTLSLRDVLAGLAGTADEGTVLVVREWRLPRALLAALFGAALGMSGAVFQSLTRNPLGSPDIIGFASGSYTGALMVMLVTGGGYFAVAAGALGGGIITAFIVFALAYRRGVQGFRLIIVGIGVSAMLAAFNTFLMLKSTESEQLTAAVWGSGSLNGLTVATLCPALIVFAVLLVPTLLLSPRCVCLSSAMTRPVPSVRVRTRSVSQQSCWGSHWLPSSLRLQAPSRSLHSSHRRSHAGSRARRASASSRRVRRARYSSW